MILIKNVQIHNANAPLTEKMEILIKDNVIHSIGQNLTEHLPPNISGDHLQVIDASGCMALPGLVDVHVHFRDPGFLQKEDLISGSQAAVAGGYTTVVTMANTSPLVDNVGTLQDIINRSKQLPLRLLSCACVTKGFKGKELTAMDELLHAGAAGFTDDGIPLMNTTILKEAMKKCAELGVPLSLHEEDPSLITNNGINNKIADALGLKGSPQEAETTMVARDAMLSLATNYPLHLQHISAAQSVHIIRLAKSLGAPITAEVTPHHFTLTQDALTKHQSHAKMNPPLRTEDDRQELLRGLQDSTLNIIATDHAPHTKEEKSRSLPQAPSGIIGLQTALPLAITHLVRPGILSLDQLVQRMSTEPAKLYNLKEPMIACGYPADICIVNINENYIFTEKNNRSHSSNSPFMNENLFGKIHYTIANGNIVYMG